MHSLTRPLALVAVAALAACGGGSSAGPSTVVPVARATANAAATGRANVTLKFTKTIKVRKRAASTARKPAYVSAGGQSIVVSVNGTIVDDPNNGYVPYFNWSGTNNDGSVTITVPITPGTYPTNAITFAEYDNSDGTGNGLAFGSNDSYTDSTGVYHDGTATVAAGSTTNLTVTMAMNATSIGVTTDPVNGNDSTQLSNSSSSPTLFVPCDGPILYFFPMDAGGNFVPPSVGYTGGDSDNNIPGLPSLNLFSTTPSGATLVPSISGGTAYTVSSTGTSSVKASFSGTNPVYYLGSPFSGVPYSYNGYVNVSESGC